MTKNFLLRKLFEVTFYPKHKLSGDMPRCRNAVSKPRTAFTAPLSLWIKPSNL